MVDVLGEFSVASFRRGSTTDYRSLAGELRYLADRCGVPLRELFRTLIRERSLESASARRFEKYDRLTTYDIVHIAEQLPVSKMFGESIVLLYYAYEMSPENAKVTILDLCAIAGLPLHSVRATDQICLISAEDLLGLPRRTLSEGEFKG